MTNKADERDKVSQAKGLQEAPMTKKEGKTIEFKLQELEQVSKTYLQGYGKGSTDTLPLNDNMSSKKGKEKITTPSEEVKVIQKL